MNTKRSVFLLVNEWSQKNSSIALCVAFGYCTLSGLVRRYTKLDKKVDTLGMAKMEIM